MDTFPQYCYHPTQEEMDIAQYRGWLSPGCTLTDPTECEIKTCLNWLLEHEAVTLTPEDECVRQTQLRRLRELADLPDLPFPSLLNYFPYGKYLGTPPSTPYLYFLFNGYDEEEALKLVFWREFILDLIARIEEYGASGKVVYCNKPAKGQQWLKSHDLEPASLPAELYRHVQYLGEQYKRFDLPYADIKACLPAAANLSAQFTSSFEIIQLHNFYLLFTYY